MCFGEWLNGSCCISGKWEGLTCYSEEGKNKKKNEREREGLTCSSIIICYWDWNLFQSKIFLKKNIFKETNFFFFSSDLITYLKMPWKIFSNVLFVWNFKKKSCFHVEIKKKSMQKKVHHSNILQTIISQNLT